MKTLFFLLFPTLASSFVLEARTRSTFSLSPPFYAVDPNNEGQEESDGLVLNGLDQEMAKMSTKYSFAESDFLAAARKRAEQQVESSTSGATDEEWQAMANEKKEQFGSVDDWDNSMKEAGNADSQILMSIDPPTDGDDEDGEGGEPKLMLF